MKASMRQQGAALIVAMALMLILALLASSGMRQSIAELVMAGNEQYRQAASMAASAGIEAAIAQIARQGARPTSSETLSASLSAMLGSEAYAVKIRYAGDELNLPGSSVGKLVGHHYEITSVGTSARFARDEQVQGVMVVSAAPDGISTYRQRGVGLNVEVTP